MQFHHHMQLYWNFDCKQASPCGHGSVYNGEMHATIKREKRVANTVGLILMALCFTLLPAMLTPVVLLHLGYSRNTIPLRLFYAILITLNSLLNPLLNYGRNEEVRMAVRMTIRCQCLTRDQQHSRLDDNRQSRINLSTLRVNNRVTNLPPVRQQPSNSGSHQVSSITNLWTKLQRSELKSMRKMRTPTWNERSIANACKIPEQCDGRSFFFGHKRWKNRKYPK